MGKLIKPVNVGDSFAGHYLEQALRKFAQVDALIRKHEALLEDLKRQRAEYAEEIEILRREP